MFGEQVRRREEFWLGVSAADAERSVDQLQQTGPLSKHGVGFTQPLRQVKLDRERSEWFTVTTALGMHQKSSLCCVRVKAHLGEQHEDDISTVQV